MRFDASAVAWSGDGHTWTDLTGLASDFTLDESGPQLHQKLIGLEQSSFTVSGTFDGSPAAWFPVPQPRVAISYDVPDGRWQAFKYRLKQYRWLRWIPVRMRNYSWTGVLQSGLQEDEDGVGVTLTVDADSPIERGTRRR